MKRIEIDKAVIDVPETWDDITLGFYETWFFKTPLTRLEKVQLVAEICKIDPSVLLNYPIGLTNLIIDTLDFIFRETTVSPSPSIVVEGVKYTIPITESLTTACWIDAEQAQKDKVAILSNILAIVCQPNGETYDPNKSEERRKMFAELKVSEVLPLLSFFLHYKKMLETPSMMFSQIRGVAYLYVNSTENFPNVGGGTKLLRTWRAVRYYALTKWLRYQLRKYLRSLDTSLTVNNQKLHKESLKSN